MNYPENITTSLENSRNCLKRIARNDDTEFSHQSILNLMERFVKVVNLMDDTILVPSRLMGLKVGDDHDPALCEKHGARHKKRCVQELFQSEDLFQVYNLLNGVKGDLLWSHGCTEEETEGKTGHLFVKGHARRPSTVSVTSTNSSASTMSDTESDVSTELDSGIEEPNPRVESGFGGQGRSRTEQLAEEFRRHLAGLTSSLKQMAEVAQYVTQRYQHDIGGPV